MISNFSEWKMWAVNMLCKISSEGLVIFPDMFNAAVETLHKIDLFSTSPI